MAFLTINGVTIPVTDASLQPVEIGSRDRTIDGTLFLGRRAVKRSWRVTTKPLDYATANAVWGLVQGNGIQSKFDSATEPQSTSLADTATAQGIVSSVTGPLVETTTAADGGAVYTKFGPNSGDNLSIANFGTGSLIAFSTTTNLLAANPSSFETNVSTGVTNIGTTGLSQASNFYWTGTKSCKVTVTGSPLPANEGVALGNATTVASTSYLASAYVRTSSQTTVSIVGQTSAGVNETTVSTFVIPAGGWYRIFHKFTASTTSSRVAIYIASGTAAVDLYIDGAMICAEPTASNPYWSSPWVIGGTTRTAAGGVTYTANALNCSAGLTISCWSNGHPYSSGNNYLVRVYSGSNFFGLVHNASAYPGFTYNGSPFSFQATAHLPSSGVWKHICGVWDPTASVIRAYINGTLVDSDSLTLSSGFGTPTSIVSEPGHRVDQLTILPYAATDAMVSALYAETTSPWPTLPNLSVSGDMTFNEPVTCLGNTTDGSYVRLFGSSGLRPHVVLQFALEEV